MTPVFEPRIVVGLDNTPASAAALRWAVTEAERLGRAVLAIHIQPTRTHPPIAGAHRPRPFDWVLRALRRTGCAVPITIETRTGDPGPALCAAATGARLLVLGVNQADGVPYANDVVAHCRANAGCPVIVITEAGHVLDQYGRVAG